MPMPMPMPMPSPEREGRTTVVIATRNRAEELCRTLERLTGLPEQPPVIVVDNASTDATATYVRQRFPAVKLLMMSENLGAAARNEGVRAAETSFVAFSDDDSWWEPGALALAERLFDASPRLGLVAARTLVGPDRELDPVSLLMWRSPLPSADAGRAQRPVLGFLACSAVVRREAFLGVGGFAPFIMIGGEERLLSYDLAADGWDLVHAPEVVACHHPSRSRDPAARRMLEVRNALLIDWLRRPWPRVLRSTTRLLRMAAHEPATRRAVLSAAGRLPGLLSERRPLPAHVERAARMLEAGGQYGLAF